MKLFFILIFLFINIILFDFSSLLQACDQDDDEDLDSLKITFVAIRENISSPLNISISDLPDELLFRIFKHLSIPDFQRSRQVCQRWESIVEEVHFLDRILLFIQQNQDKRKDFFTLGNPYQISYCILKDQNLILGLKECLLFPRLQNIVYANPDFFQQFWEFACSKVLKFNYPSELPYQTVDTWFLHGKILFLCDPLDKLERLNAVFQTLKSFIASDQYMRNVRSKDINLLKLYILSDVTEDRQMLRIACNERIQVPNGDKPHPLEKWLEQVEIQWQLLDNFKTHVQAQIQLQAGAATAATTAQAQPQ